MHHTPGSTSGTSLNMKQNKPSMCTMKKCSSSPAATLSSSLQRDADVHVHHGSGSTTSTRAGQHHIVLAKVLLKSKLSGFCSCSNMIACTCSN